MHSFILIILLISIIYQDFKNREVDIYSLSFFCFFSIANSIYINGFFKAVNYAIFPIIFIIIQLIILTGIYSYKKKKIVSIIDKQLGKGDILFWFGLVFSFSILNFLGFFIISIIIISIISFIKKLKTIPLAGGQSILLILFIISNNLIFKINPYFDFYLSNLLY